MNRVKSVSRRLVVFLLLFSFLVGFIPLNNTGKVYAEKKDTAVLVITDDQSLFSHFKTGANCASSIKTLVTDSGSNASSYQQFLGGCKQDIKSFTKNYKHVVVIIFPCYYIKKASGTGYAPSGLRDTEDKYTKATVNIINALELHKNDKIKKVLVYGAEKYFQSSAGNYRGQPDDTKLKNINNAKKINEALVKKIKDTYGKSSKITYYSDIGTYVEQDETTRATLVSQRFCTTDSKLKDGFSVEATQGGDSSNSDDITYANTEELLSEIGVDKKYKSNIEAYAQYLLGLGYSEAATAGVLANMWQESKFNPTSGTASAGGLFGFTGLDTFSNSKINKECKEEGKHKRGTIGGIEVCIDDKSCQIQFMLSKLKSAIDTYSYRIKPTNEFFANATSETVKTDGTTDKKKIKLPDKKMKEIKNLDEFKSLDNPYDASGIFMICYERCAGTYEPANLDTGSGKDYHKLNGKITWHDYMLIEWNQNSNDGNGYSRYNVAKPIYDWLGGSALSNADSTKAREMAEEAAKKGYLTEEELSAWTKIVNEKFINYKEVTRNSLTQSELSSLSRWEQNVGYDDLENHGIFHFFRVIFMIFAIFLIIWSVLLYCAFWFDKVNPFCFDVSLVSLLTLGKLSTAPTEEECNYTTRNFFKEHKGSKFINHKYMASVCLLLIGFAVLILTGFLYKIILTVIGLVAKLFGI